MVVRRKRACHSGASPSLVGCSFLDNSLGCRGIPKLKLFYPSFIHRKITQYLKTSSTQNFNRKLSKIRQYNKANHYSKYCCKPIHIFFHCSCCNITFSWLNPLIEIDSFIKTSKLCIKNRICQKQNSLQQSEHPPYLWYPKNSTKIRKKKQVLQKDSAKGIRTNLRSS